MIGVLNPCNDVGSIIAETDDVTNQSVCDIM